MEKTILITGCSSGIGYYAARTLKKRGYCVFATARQAEDIGKLNAEGLNAIHMDLNDSQSIRKGLEAVLSQTNGKLDYLFNNAGYLQAGAIEDLTRNMDLQQFETNVFGAMDLIRQVLHVMREQGHGRIVQNSSILGIITLPYCGAYNASKFAVEGYCNTLRQELRGTNIHISLINPGAIKSKLRENAYLHFKEKIDAKQSSVHQPKYQALEKSYFSDARKDDMFTMQPEAIIGPLLHALESKRPKAHYFVGMAAKGMALLKRILPDCMMDWVLAKVR